MKKILLFLSVLFVVSCSKDPIIYTLTTSANPAEGGTVNQSSEQFNEGETATITAFPSYSYEFLNWSNGLGTSNSTTVVMDSDKAITANFNKKTPTIIKLEVEEHWDKVIFPLNNVRANLSCSSQSGVVDVSDPKYRMSSTDLMLPQKNNHYSLDSLIIDFTKFDNTDINGNLMEGAGLFIRKTERVTVKFPKKIGYIKIIGDTTNKNIFWELDDVAYLPISYGDSNIDFSELVFKFFANGNRCNGPSSINDNFSSYFVKGDVSKPKSTLNINFDSNNDSYNTGDIITTGNGSYKILSKSYEYD
tara:strand:+ start:221 stop:1132 length:912 start_codon:yes stop_codon:yes gene_type:complete